MKIQESAENYLETILMLNKTRNVVRAIDIVNELKEYGITPAIADPVADCDEAKHHYGIDFVGMDEVKNQKEALSNYNIFSIGRYGSWNYSSIEDNMKEAIALAKQM